MKWHQGMVCWRRFLTGVAGRGVFMLLAAQIVPAMAGTITLDWDPITSPDLAGYRIYTGTASGSYSQTSDVGAAATTQTIGGLNDCTTYYLAMKSVATDGSESASFSQEVVGFTRPSLSLVQPGLVAPGSTVQLVLDGISFQSGATLAFSVPGISVTAMNVQSCSRATATVTVATGAPLGAVDVSIVNPGNVPITLAAAMTLTTDTGPALVSIQPVDGAVDVLPGTVVTATFDRDLLASSVNSASVLLLDAGGTPIAQAAGSPALVGNVVTLQPAVPLAQGSTCRLQIVGGTGGVKDTAGIPLPSTFLQAQGFVILNVPPAVVDNLRRMDLSGS